MDGLGQVEIEVIDISQPPATPTNLTAPPTDATKTASGLAYKILKKEQEANIQPPLILYRSITPAGQATAPCLTQALPVVNRFIGADPSISGWTEVLQLMKEGDSFRVWIPENLAYKGQPGAPAGMLIFDIELLSISQ